MLVSSVLEGVSVGAIIPLFSLLMEPSAIITLVPIDLKTTVLFDLSEETLRYTLCSVFLFVIILTGFVRTMLLWCINIYTGLVSHDVSVKIFEITLKRSYYEHMSTNSSTVLTGITHKAGAVSNIVLSLITIIISLLTIVSIFFALLLINPTMAISMGVSFLAIYFVVAYTVQRSILSNGKGIVENQTVLFRMAQEALGGIKVIILNSSHAMCIRNFAKFDYPMRKAQATNKFFYGFPRLILEPIGVALLVIVALMTTSDHGVSTLPMLGAIALGGQRLMPALQQCYGAWAAVKGNQAPVLDAARLLVSRESTQLQEVPSRLNFERFIRFDNIEYKFGPDERVILSDYTLLIEKGARVGLVGLSGSGKSTFLAITMGLLQPTKGKITVDDVELSAPRIPDWQMNVGHVPQDVFLIDGTLIDNIAFGVEASSVDISRVYEAIALAELGDFVAQRDHGIYSQVGERGATISGGERQRIGIARAIYQRRPFLVLDEATSALDRETEARIMSRLFSMSPTSTMLIAAHRLESLRGCDYFIELKIDGPVTYHSYQTLLSGYLAKVEHRARPN